MIVEAGYDGRRRVRIPLPDESDSTFVVEVEGDLVLPPAVTRLQGDSYPGSGLHLQVQCGDNGSVIVTWSQTEVPTARLTGSPGRQVIEFSMRLYRTAAQALQQIGTRTLEQAEVTVSELLRGLTQEVTPQVDKALVADLCTLVEKHGFRDPVVVIGDDFLESIFLTMADTTPVAAIRDLEQALTARAGYRIRVESTTDPRWWDLTGSEGYPLSTAAATEEELDELDEAERREHSGH